MTLELFLGTKMPCHHSFALAMSFREEGGIIVCLFLTKLIFFKAPISLPLHCCAMAAVPKPEPVGAGL